jgi:four helix bundle protein
MRINSFEELDAWKEARILYKMVVEATGNSSVGRDYVFTNQIRAAALSVMSNIAEGFESLSVKERINFLNFARRSCGEVRSQLYAGLDVRYFDKDGFEILHNQTVRTGKIISGFISYLKEKRQC